GRARRDRAPGALPGEQQGERLPRPTPPTSAIALRPTALTFRVRSRPELRPGTERLPSGHRSRLPGESRCAEPPCPPSASPRRCCSPRAADCSAVTRAARTTGAAGSPAAPEGGFVKEGYVGNHSEQLMHARMEVESVERWDDRTMLRLTLTSLEDEPLEMAGLSLGAHRALDGS